MNSSLEVLSADQRTSEGTEIHKVQGKAEPYVMAVRVGFSNVFLLKTLFIEFHLRVFT